MNKKIISCDIDGTLYKDWLTPDMDSINYLKSIKDEHIIILATGRPYRASKYLYELLELDTPLINVNGAVLHNPADRDFGYFKRTIDKNIVLDLINNNSKLIKNYMAEHFAAGYDFKYVKENNDYIKNFLMGSSIDTIYEGELNESTLDREITGLVLFAEKGCEKELVDIINNDKSHNLICRNWGKDFEFVVEVYFDDCDKSTALDQVLKHYNMSSKDLISFGDAENDIGMLKLSGVGVAMGNASEDVKSIANDVTVSVHDSGVKKYLENYLKK